MDVYILLGLDRKKYIIMEMKNKLRINKYYLYNFG